MSETNGKKLSRNAMWDHMERSYLEFDHPVLGKVTIQNLTDKEHRALGSKLFDEEGNRVGIEYAFADRAIAQIVDPDEDYLPMFSEMDREKLATIPYHISRDLMQSMQDHNDGGGLTRDELKKKSETPQTST